MYKKYKKSRAKFIKRSPGGSMGGSDAISAGLSFLGDMIPESDVLEKTGKSSAISDTVNAAAVQGLNTILPGSGTALNMLTKTTGNLRKTNCVPDPSSPTGEKCFEDEKGAGEVVANIFDPGKTAGDMVDGFTTLFKDPKQGAKKLVDTFTFGITNFDKSKEDAYAEALKEDNQRKKNERFSKVNTQANKDKILGQQLGAAQFQRNTQTYAKKGGSLFNRLKKGGTVKDRCYYKCKASYKVFPSAYASGCIAKCRKNKS